jgi:WD40 repeat protein
MTTLTPVAQLADVTAPVTAVAFSPDGNYLAYGTSSGALILNDTLRSTRTTLAQIPRVNRIDDIEFSSDNSYLLVYGTGSPTTAVGTTSGWAGYDLPATSPIVNMPTVSWVRSLAFSPDNALIGWLDTSVHLLNTDQSGAQRVIPLEDPPTNAGAAGTSLAWRPTQSSQEVAFVDGASVRLVNLTTNTEQAFLGDENFTPSAIAFSIDGALLAAMNVPDSVTASVVNIFAADTGDLITSTPLDASRTLVFSPDGTLLVIASNDEVLFLGVDNTEIAAG